MEQIISIENIKELVGQILEKEASESIKDQLSKIDLDLLAKSSIQDVLNSAVKEKLLSLDFRSLIKDTVETIIESKITTLSFPQESIPASAISFKKGKLSGSQISGGIIEEFGSTGIDDQASNCNLTVMDDLVVVENTLVAKTLEIKNNVTIEGDLHVSGDINLDGRGIQRLINQVSERTRNSVREDMADTLVEETTKRIKESGLEVKAITVDGHEILDSNSLAKFITGSNLQKVGALKELQVRGESILSDTLYTTKQRVGINTMEPSRALAVWDDECEVVIAKHERQTGYIGTIRNQKLILGSDSQTNIMLEPDGSTKIFDLRIGNTKLQSSDTIPNHNGTRGEIVFNSSPELGKPYGWMCLGEARWACMPALTG